MLKFVFEGSQREPNNLNYYFIVEKYKKCLKLHELCHFFQKNANNFGRFFAFFRTIFLTFS